MGLLLGYLGEGVTVEGLSVFKETATGWDGKSACSIQTL